ncbi:hypothetical protein H5410_021030 [Solanum commersonii]|uniref:Uncharacterized protein n=1 Tax=Solanum commersonii TaxID=4109 RepID=A0A9J5ZBJ3_SOLCO|nr:hypothetical protein H5410_021030 [Solanum commersonii]
MDFMKSKKVNNTPPSYTTILMDEENTKVFDLNNKREVILLLEIRSGEFQHIYPVNTRKVYNFSKIIIKKILTTEEWGMIPLKEMDYIHPKQKVAICSNIFGRKIPNWICKWWTLYGPSIKILPEQYKKLYSEWIDISPKLIKFSIPWIMKWSVDIDNTYEGFPCLQRTFYTKFWNKLVHKDLEGKIQLYPNQRL